MKIRSFIAAALGAATLSIATDARAESLLLIEADTGRILHSEQPTQPWYPASVTKIMTAYVALKAVKEGRLSLDTLLTVSPVAAAEQPSKMGFASGTRLTLDNALKMMMVKSANDIAVVIAEGVSGSVEGFALDMNRAAQRLGMTQTNYVNPNGLPDDRQVTSARDQAMLARAVYRELPEYDYYMRIQAIKHGRRVTQNFNRLMGRYPGADGMKTGFICASGYNLVGSATRNGKRLIAVVLGSSSGQMRAVRAAQLLDRGFGANSMTWLRPTSGTIDNLAPIDAAPPNLRDEMCGPRRKRPASDADEESVAETANPALALFTAGLPTPTLRPVDMIAAAPAPTEPVIVYTGPKRSEAEAIAANEAEAATQAAAAAAARAARTKNTKNSKKPATRVIVDVKPKAGTDKPAAAAKPSNAKSAAPKAAAKPAVATPAKPQTQAQPAITSKPLPKPTPPAADAKKPPARPTASAPQQKRPAAANPPTTNAGAATKPKI